MKIENLIQRRHSLKHLQPVTVSGASEAGARPAYRVGRLGLLLSQAPAAVRQAQLFTPSHLRRQPGGR